MEDGEVVSVGSDGSRGNYVTIKYDDPLGDGDIYVDYYHLAGRPIVNVGDAVNADTVVGTMGNTGDSMGAHLHLGIRQTEAGQGIEESQWVDPVPYLFPEIERDYSVETKQDIQHYEIFVENNNRNIGDFVGYQQHNYNEHSTIYVGGNVERSQTNTIALSSKINSIVNGKIKYEGE